MAREPRNIANQHERGLRQPLVIDDEDGHEHEISNRPRNLATVKFNFIAWAFRNGKRNKLGAVDLMVLAQLIVRYDPERGAFPMSAEALAHRTGTAVSSVRRSLRYLEKLGDIDVVPKPGHSSLYRVRFEVAKPGWIAHQSRQYNEKFNKRNGITPPSRSLAKSGYRSVKMLEGGAPKSDKAPSQNLGTISISLNHPDFHISPSMRPDGLEAEDAGALKREKRLRLQGEDDAAFEGRGTSFDRFVVAWPKADHDVEKLKAAWYKRVIKPGYDPEDVVEAALAWRRYFYSEPDAIGLPFAGKWLAEQGWLELPPQMTEEEEARSRFFESVATRERG